MQRCANNANNQSDDAIRETTDYIGQTWILKQRVTRRDKEEVGCNEPEDQSDQARTQAPKPNGYGDSTVKRDEWCVRSKNRIKKGTYNTGHSHAGKCHTVTAPA